MFLDSDWKRAVASQAGTFALVPQIADAVSVPVLAAGGIGDGRGIEAAFALGAAGVQIGTAFLLCAEAATPPLHREALRNARVNQTVVTNVFSGRPARVLVNRLVAEIGPWSDALPDFPLAMGELPPDPIPTPTSVVVGSSERELTAIVGILLCAPFMARGIGLLD